MADDDIAIEVAAEVSAPAVHTRIVVEKHVLVHYHKEYIHLHHRRFADHRHCNAYP